MPPKKSGGKPAAKAAPKKAPERKKTVDKTSAAASGNTSLYIKNFKMDGKDYQDIRAFFANFGTLLQLRIKRSKTTKNGPYILAFYKDAAGARKCVEQCKTVDGQRVSVEYCKNATVRPDRSTRCSTLFVSPVNKAVKKADLKKEVVSVGGAKPIRVRTYVQGYAMIYYNSVSDANSVYAKLAGNALLGKPVKVKYSVRTKERDQKRFVKPLEAFRRARALRKAAAEARMSKAAKARRSKRLAEQKKAKASPKAAAPKATPKATSKASKTETKAAPKTETKAEPKAETKAAPKAAPKAKAEKKVKA